MDSLACNDIECRGSEKHVPCSGSSDVALLGGEHAATLVEYSLLLILIMVAAILSLQFFSESVSERYSIISSAVRDI